MNNTKKRRSASVAIIATFGFHIVALVIAAMIMIDRNSIEKKEDFETLKNISTSFTQQRTTRSEGRIHKLVKQSSLFKPSTILVHNPNDVELPSLHEIKLSVQKSSSDAESSLSSPDVSSSGSTFFGIDVVGKYINFILDYSGSMASNNRGHIMHREMEHAIKALPNGTHISVICFGDKAQFLPLASKRRYIEITDVSRSILIKQIRERQHSEGTHFGPPFTMAFHLTPMPDNIYFMTDGQCSRRKGINIITRVGEDLSNPFFMPVINVIGLDVKGDGIKHLSDIAEYGNGKVIFIDPSDYMENYRDNSNFYWPASTKRTDQRHAKLP